MTRRHIMLAILVTAIWGFNFVIIKVGLDNFPPFLFSALRFALTAFPIILILGPRDAPWRSIIIVGVVLGIIKFSLLFIGMDIGVSAGIASVVLQCQAFFTVVFAALLLDEYPTPKEWAGIATAFFGIAIIATTMQGTSILFGLGLVVLSGATWAASNILMKQAGQVNMLRFIAYVSLIPPIPLLVMSYYFEGPDTMINALSNLTTGGVTAVLYIAFASTIFGFGVWGYLLRQYPAAKVAPFTLLVPIFGLSSSTIFLGEEFGLTRLLGSICVWLGLAIIFWPIKRSVYSQKT